ncbi:MAG: TlpA family protein disulfide reductase [Thermodesulfovibrionales bacterium]
MDHTQIKGSVCFILSICLSLLFAASTGRAGAADNKPVSPFEINKLQKAPEFSAKDLNGATVSLSSLKGKVVLINFWATWCPACIAEMPSLNSLNNNRELKAKGFEVITVSADESANDVKKFLTKQRVSLRVLMDGKKSVSRQFKVFSIPTTFLIDRQGNISEKFFGEYDWTDKEIREKIDRLL